jgi:hypothetical protein
MTTPDCIPGSGLDQDPESRYCLCRRCRTSFLPLRYTPGQRCGSGQAHRLDPHLADRFPNVQLVGNVGDFRREAVCAEADQVEHRQRLGCAQPLMKPVLGTRVTSGMMLKTGLASGALTLGMIDYHF